MLEIILFINGIVFCYLLFSKKNSENNTDNAGKAANIGMGLFIFFIVILSILHLLKFEQLTKLLTLLAALVTSLALGIRLLQLAKKGK